MRKFINIIGFRDYISIKLGLIDNYLKNKFMDCVILKFINNKKRTININEIIFRSFEIRDLKIEIIKRYLNKIYLNNSLKKHLFNYLYINRKNSIHKKICLIKYLLNKKFNIEKISASFLSKKDISIFKEYNLNIKKVKSFKGHIESIYIINLFIYTLTKRENPYEEKSNYNPKIKYLKLLRGATFKVAENIYLKKLNKSFDNTIISVFPGEDQDLFEYLKTNNRDYFVYNPKIRYYEKIKNGISIYLKPIPKEIKVHLFRVIIERKKIDDYVTYLKRNFRDICEVYTKEEFYHFSYYLTEKLKESKIKTINFAHGLGVYCPFVNYDIFYVFSKIQKRYYFGPSNFKYFKLGISSIKKNKNVNKQFALFYIAQNIFSNKQSITLKSSHKELVNFIERISREGNFSVYAKYHPKHQEAILSKKIKIINNIDDLPTENRYLAITFSSTYAIELVNSMPFLIVNPKGKVNLKYFFPDKDIIYAKTYQQFKNKLEKFKKDPNYYYKYWDNLLSLMKEYNFYE